MLDFKELSVDGQDLELLVREILFANNVRCFWSGRGPDGGRDLLAIDDLHGFLGQQEKRWLIQCKHFAHRGNSVGVKDLDEIVVSCIQHQCEAYLLVCSTYPSSGVVARLEGVTNSNNPKIHATYWDSIRIEQLLSTPRTWRFAQRFFPVSSNALSWQIYATENPNHWIVNYKGYYFHLSNRIGSSKEHHFSSIEKKIGEIEKITFPEGHFIRIRAVFFDDKHSNYKWYLDYFFPRGKTPVISDFQIKNILGDGYALDDGCFYSFDVITRSYVDWHEHYDPDHYDYYEKDIKNFLYGGDRESGLRSQLLDYQVFEMNTKSEKINIKGKFEELISAFSLLPFLKIISSSNSQIEYLDKFSVRRDWSEIIEKHEIVSDHFFSAWFLFDVSDEKEFFTLFTFFPQNMECPYRVLKAHVYIPDGKDGSELNEENNFFEVFFKVNPNFVTDKLEGRTKLNGMFDRVISGVNAYIQKKNNP
jgi:hypothetical protein